MNVPETVFRLFLSFLAIYAFSIMYSAPRSQCSYCGICGCFTWGISYLMEELGAGNMLSVLTATFFLTLLTRILSVQRKTPITIYLMTGVLPLVPGAGIYYTSYYLMLNQAGTAARMGLETFQTAGAISFGIVFGFAVPLPRLRPR